MEHAAKQSWFTERLLLGLYETQAGSSKARPGDHSSLELRLCRACTGRQDHHPAHCPAPLHTHTTQSSQDQFHILTTDMTTHAQHLYRIALHGSGHNVQVWLTQLRLSQVRMKAAMASEMSCVWSCRSFDTDKHGAG